MNDKRFLGKLITLHFTDRQSPVRGYVIDYNADWTLLKYNAVDYLTDGFMIVRHKHIKKIERGDDEIWTEKVMNLKGLQPDDSDKVPLDNLETILQTLSENFGLFTLYMKSESACHVGRLKSFEGNRFTIDYLTPRARWEGTMSFIANNIRIIEFDNDYLRSLRCVYESRKKKI